MTHPDHRRDTDLEGGGAPDPHYQGKRWPPPDDEISLFDLWDSLVRRRWLILGVAAAVTALAAAYAMTRPDVYRYETSLRIGQMVVNAGVSQGKHEAQEPGEGQAQRAPIATPTMIKAQLDASIIPAAVRRVSGLNEGEVATGDTPIPDVEVTSPDGTEVVHLRIESPGQETSTYLEILRGAASQLVRVHAESLASERIRLEKQLERLDQREQRVTSQLEQTRSRIDRLANTDGTSESVVVLRIDRLEQRAAELQDRLLDIQAQRDLANDYLATINENADLFTGEMNPQTFAEQREAANQIVAISGGIRPTTVISPPERTLTQPGTSGAMILAMGMALGGMLAVFAAFFAEFIAAARRRHQPTGDAETIEHRA